MHSKAVALTSLLIILALSQAYSQTRKDQDLKDSYDLKEIRKFVDENHPLVIPAAKTFLNQAKLTGDSLTIARGYENLVCLFTLEINIKYADSIIMYSENLGHPNYPGVGYAFKGYWSLYNDDYKNAWEYYQMAYDDAQSKGNKDYALNYLGVIIYFKSQQIGERPPLNLLHKYYNEVQKLPDSSAAQLINRYYAYLGLSEAYLTDRKIDSADYWIEQGINFALGKNDRDFLNDFKTLKAEVKYAQKDYADALHLWEGYT
ncbi:MAG: hypothetical protein WBG71_09215 [Leeuwenhoekiella sp.]